MLLATTNLIRATTSQNIILISIFIKYLFQRRLSLDLTIPFAFSFCFFFLLFLFAFSFCFFFLLFLFAFVLIISERR